MVNGRTEAEDMVAQARIAELKQQRNYWIGVASAFDEHLATMRVMLMEQPPARFGGAEPRLTDAEREAVEWFSQLSYGEGGRVPDYAATLRKLLERLK